MGAAEKDLVPVEQREVEFYGDELTAVRVDGGHIYASLRHMCQALNIDTTGQRQRIQRHRVLNNGLGVCKIQTPGGGRQDAYMLRVDLVPLWLTGIRTNMVDEAVRPKLDKFQEEASAVLWEAFQEGRLTMDSTFDDLLTSDTPAVQAYKMLQAMTRLARQQVLIEAQQQAQQVQLADHENRLESIEAQLGAPDRAVTEAQATQISQAVKAVALALSKQSGRNEYGGVYGELYRRYEVNSYKLLPAARFDDAIGWLNEWLQSLTGNAAF